MPLMITVSPIIPEILEATAYKQLVKCDLGLQNPPWAEKPKVSEKSIEGGDTLTSAYVIHIATEVYNSDRQLSVTFCIWTCD